MSEFPVYYSFYPLLIATYIRLMTVVENIHNEEAGNPYEPVPVKFKIAKEYYRQVETCEVRSPFLGLDFAYDEASEILTVTPEAYVLEWYTNKIMKEVALRQEEELRVRYSDFIQLLKQ